MIPPVSRRMVILSKAFTEKIMLAVTQVNGCRYCSWFHTRVALKEGISKTEIHNLLGGEFEGVDEDELLALLYAQHYADTGGKPEEESRENLYEAYGKERARGIEASIKAITVGNIYGIVFGSLLMFPVSLLHSLVKHV